MGLQIAQFNPEYRRQDRRQNNFPVLNERRSGHDRRSITERINDLDQKIDNKQAILYGLSPIPTIRRTCSLPDEIEKGDFTKAAGLVGLAVANLPSDLREMGLAFKDGFAKNPYQHELSFFKGTILKPLTQKHKWLKKADKTLFFTKFGQFIQKKLGLGVDFTDIGKVKETCHKVNLTGYKYTGNFLQQTMGRALTRIPVIGLATSSLFEIPALVKSVTKTEGSLLDKTKAFGKQLIKSSGYIGLTTAGIAIGGALLFPHGAILGLVGMGIGSTIALLAYKELNKLVDNLT